MSEAYSFKTTLRIICLSETIRIMCIIETFSKIPFQISNAFSLTSVTNNKVQYRLRIPSSIYFDWKQTNIVNNRTAVRIISCRKLHITTRLMKQTRSSQIVFALSVHDRGRSMFEDDGWMTSSAIFPIVRSIFFKTEN